MTIVCDQPETGISKHRAHAIINIIENIFRSDNIIVITAQGHKNGMVSALSVYSALILTGLVKIQTYFEMLNYESSDVEQSI